MVDSAKKSVKVVVVGDGAVGKTCLITAYGENRFPDDYIPTVSDTYEGPCEYEGSEVALKIWDTAGQAEFAAVRPVAYNDAECFDLSLKCSIFERFMIRQLLVCCFAQRQLPFGKVPKNVNRPRTYRIWIV